jgi:DNA-binding SARP family transcriptional activator
MEFRLLGPLEVHAGGEPLALGGRKQRGILALLLLYPNQVVSTDRLIDELWGERPPRTVQAYVQNCVSRLRGVLGHELIERQAPGYLLRVDPESVDALRFERAVEAAASLGPQERAAALREALDFWRGSPLADLTFEGSARVETARLEELRLTALELRIDAELELGRHDNVLAELDALASRHPGRERLRYLQMLALYRSGRQRDALRAYQEARLDLVEQFGLEPGEELRALERMIISHDPSLRLAEPVPEEVDSERRRHIVALAVELVVAESLGEDPAHLGLATYLAEAAIVIGRHGGVPQQLVPDDVTAIFGAPRSREDDTMRALRAASEIRDLLPEGVSARLAVERAAVDAVGAARRLLAFARSGDLLLGPAALRLVPRAVDVVPDSSGDGYRVLRFDPDSEPFLRHLDTPLVGRRAELARLDAELAAVVRDQAARRVVVLGEAGIGKTRLVREFAARVQRSAQVLTGRCAAYAEGSDLLPLRDILSQVGQLETVLASDEDAERVIAQLREPSLTEKAEGSWALRRLLEAVARRQPLVLVLEDIHWAGPALLDLVEYLVGWTGAALLVVSAARPELLEARPEWRDDAILLGPLTAADLSQLAAALKGDADLESPRLVAAVAAAEGNPLFLEQLLAAGREESLEPVPPTIEVLIESRLDRLPTNERQMLERASVVGREFWRAAVEAVSPEDERPGVSPALMALVRRRLIHPERSQLLGQEGFRFHHTLIRDVVYAGIPESTRAALHEGVSRSLTGRDSELDELVGYHLEQAVLLRARTGDPTEALAAEAGRRLGAAGLRAMKRVDGPAGVDLLTRATALLPDDPKRLELDWALATSVKFAGDPLRADELLDAVAEKASRWSDARIELRARIEQIWGRLTLGQLSVEAALDLLARAAAVFSEAGDEVGLGRAWHLTAAVNGVYRYHDAEAEQAALRGGRHYERSGFGRGLTLVLLSVSAYRGPTPAVAAIDRCEKRLLDAPTPVWESFILPFLAAVEAMTGRFASAREHLEEARVGRQEFSDPGTIVTSWSAIAAEVELLAGAPERAAAILLDSCRVLQEAGEIEWLATNTALLGEAQYRQGRFEAALSSSNFALETAPAEHLTSRSVARRVKAKALARLGEHREGVALAAEALRSLEHTDVLNERGETLVACAEALALSGDEGAATARLSEAVSVFEQKGNTVSAERARYLPTAPG